MKFLRGVLIGGAATMGAIIMYNEMSNRSKKQMIRKGKQFAKKMGVL